MAISTVRISAASAPVLAPAALGIVANEIERRRLGSLLQRVPYEVVASAENVNALLDHASRPLEAVVFAGGSELLARGGPVELLHTLRPASAIVVVSGGGPQYQ